MGGLSVLPHPRPFSLGGEGSRQYMEYPIRKVLLPSPCGRGAGGEGVLQLADCIGCHWRVASVKREHGLYQLQPTSSLFLQPSCKPHGRLPHSALRTGDTPVAPGAYSMSEVIGGLGSCGLFAA